MAMGDSIGMLEHAYYSVITPEGCASILFKDAGKNQDASAMLRLTAEDVHELGIVDEIIKEPMGGAHHDPSVVYGGVKEFLNEQRALLTSLSLDELLERRYQKYRRLGQYTESPAR